MHTSPVTVKWLLKGSKMLEILQFYMSGFWVWLGLTIALSIVVKGVVVLVLGSIALFKGKSVKWH